MATTAIPRQAIAQSVKDPEVVIDVGANTAGETLVSSGQGEMGEMGEEAGI
jgi:hypothetical protein